MGVPPFRRHEQLIREICPKWAVSRRNKFVHRGLALAIEHLAQLIERRRRNAS
jgi:hypothetical protein